MWTTSVNDRSFAPGAQYMTFYFWIMFSLINLEFWQIWQKCLYLCLYFIWLMARALGLWSPTTQKFIDMYTYSITVHDIKGSGEGGSFIIHFRYTHLRTYTFTITFALIYAPLLSSAHTHHPFFWPLSPPSGPANIPPSPSLRPLQHPG